MFTKLIKDLTETSNKIFRNLKKRGFITNKELKYFSFDHKRACTSTSFLKFIKDFNVPGRPKISRCETPSQKASFWMVILKLLYKKAGPT